MKKRKSGYYWVALADIADDLPETHPINHYEIAWYDDLPHPLKEGVVGYWHYCCSGAKILEDSDFLWISSRRLKSPPRNKYG